MMNKTNLRKFFALAALLLVFGAIVGILFFVEHELRTDTEPEKGALDIMREKEVVYFNGEAYMPRTEITSYLVIGLDSEGGMESSGAYYNTMQSDFLLLLIMDRKEKTYTLLHLNRDTMTNVRQLGVLGEPAGTTYQQLALAHTQGDGMQVSCENTVDAVSNLLYGVPIDHYLAMTLDAVPILNDYLGGVTVTVPQDLTAVDPALREGAVVTLKGKQTELFIRSRGKLADSTNLARMERQKVYLSALIQKVAEQEMTDDFLEGAYDRVSPYILTDGNVRALSDLAKQIKSYSLDRILSPEGEAVLGRDYMEFYVDDESLKSIVADLFYERAD